MKRFRAFMDVAHTIVRLCLVGYLLLCGTLEWSVSSSTIISALALALLPHPFNRPTTETERIVDGE